MSLKKMDIVMRTTRYFATTKNLARVLAAPR